MATIEEITTVCYVGAGTMGSVNALVAAVAGYETVLYDVDAETLEQVPVRQRQFADFMVSSGFCTEQDISDALRRVRTTTDPSDAAAHADLLSESVIEQLDVKRQVHAQFDELCPPRTILTTNTSALLVSDIEDVVQRGERFAALHSHLGSTLVDIVGGPRTTPGTIDVLRRYVLSLGAVPLVMKRESPGYLVNALLGPLLMTGIQLVVRDICDVHTVDSSWMASRGAPMAPFDLLDLFGLDMVLVNWEHSNPDDTPLRVARRAEAAGLVRRLVGQGKCGMKTGHGFYEYPEPGYQADGFLEAADETIHSYLLAAVAMRAALLADDDVADPDDIDHAWVTAMSLASGPFGLVEEIGVDEFTVLVERLVAHDLVDADDAERARRYVTIRLKSFDT
jgi:3-hydroxybutyryl-CoA dehydrogenase